MPAPIRPLRTYEFESMLAQYRTAATRAMFQYLPVKEPRRHLYDLLPAYPLRHGKGLRPALCMATCRAHGGSADAAEKTAVALELLHNACLIHDDIQDQTPRRRGLPTLHAEQDMPLALNAGDALAMLSLRPLFDNFASLGDLAWTVLQEFSAMAQETLEGQAMDLGWIRDNADPVTYDDYLRMVLKKTGWYTTIQPCRLGALIGSSGGADVDRVIPFGFYAGAVFQIGDDLLSLDGDPQVAGKGDPNQDLYEGKRTLMLIHLAERLAATSPEDHQRLRTFLGQPRAERSDRDVSWVRRQMEEQGSLAFARSFLAATARVATAEFETAFAHLPDSRDKEFLRAVVPYLQTRGR